MCVAWFEDTQNGFESVQPLLWIYFYCMAASFVVLGVGIAIFAWKALDDKNEVSKFISGLLVGACVLQAAHLLIDPFGVRCLMPVFLERCLYDSGFMLPLFAYYMLMQYWLIKMTAGASQFAMNIWQVLLISFVVLVIPDMALRITQQLAGQPLHHDYVLYNNIFLISISVLVALLNAYYVYKGFSMYKRIDYANAGRRRQVQKPKGA